MEPCIFCQSNESSTHVLVEHTPGQFTSHGCCEECYAKFFQPYAEVQSSPTYDATDAFLGRPLREFLSSDVYTNETELAFTFVDDDDNIIMDYNSWMAKPVISCDINGYTNTMTVVVQNNDAT